MKYFYITTPIYYVNDAPHIGHAYTSVACDMIARFKQLDGYQVKFLTGTDEHGQKVEKSAQKAGIEPQLFVDQISKRFKDLCGILDLQNDDFIRTTDERHMATAQALWQRLQANGYIYKGSYEGWYSVRDEAFYQESELVNGKAPTGAEVEWVSEESYFFALSKFQDQLLELYNNNPDFIAPKSRKNEVMSFVSGGLKDLCISRSTFSWGVPVPGDNSQVMYVWIDALTNYISALGGFEGDNYENYWPHCLHLVGKDIIRFHCVYWPAFLMAAGVKLPRQIFAHGWWTNEGQKISKSLGNAIDPVALVEQYGLDQLRYFMVREVPFGADGDFSIKALEGRINNDLGNDYGNLVQRVISFVAKHCDGIVPTPQELKPQDQAIINQAHGLISELRTHMDQVALHKYCISVWELVSYANKYVDGQAPWQLRKTDVERMHTVLYTLLEVIACISLYALPIIPKAASKVLNCLNVEPNYANMDTNKVQSNTKMTSLDILFPKIGAK